MGLRVGRVGELLGHVAPSISVGQIVGVLDGARHPGGPGRVDDFRAQRGHERLLFLRKVLGHYYDDPVAFLPGRQREADARVARGGLDDDAAGLQLSRGLRGPSKYGPMRSLTLPPGLRNSSLA